MFLIIQIIFCHSSETITGFSQKNLNLHNSVGFSCQNANLLSWPTYGTVYKNLLGVWQKRRGRSFYKKFWHDILYLLEVSCFYLTYICLPDFRAMNLLREQCFYGARKTSCIERHCSMVDISNLLNKFLSPHQNESHPMK